MAGKSALTAIIVAGTTVGMPDLVSTPLWDAPVLVWTVGKVASSSVLATLRHYGFDAVQVHNLADRNLTYQIHEMYAGRALADNIVESLRFLHGFDRNFYSPPFRVVTLVRDPLARNISAYFENLEHFSGSGVIDAEGHVQHFLDKYPHSVVLDWFDEELRTVTGIDFRRLNFDRDRGWTIRRSERFHLLVLRAEESDEVKLQALSAFFETPMTELIRENEAASKGYGDLYQAFKEKLALPQAHLDYIYDNEFCAAFWNPSDVCRMKGAWRVCEERAAPAIASVDGDPNSEAVAPSAGTVEGELECNGVTALRA